MAANRISVISQFIFVNVVTLLTSLATNNKSVKLCVNQIHLKPPKTTTKDQYVVSVVSQSHQLSTKQTNKNQQTIQPNQNYHKQINKIHPISRQINSLVIFIQLMFTLNSNCAPI